ncbi:MAG: glycosyltransferase involved in cell wall biosynthesis [Psychroserpens sp.]|jgi:glycosyltransferase involved in cell wall biosynthesis
MNDLTVVIIAFNESQHIERSVKSAFKVAAKVLVVDSLSTDDTVEKAKYLGAKIVTNTFVNHASQLNFGLKHEYVDTKWVMKLDADEYLLDELVLEINDRLPKLNNEINGIYIKRRVFFMDRWIKNGSYYPIWLLRIWKNGEGFSEQRWMDEHVKLDQPKTIKLEHDFVDENKNTLTHWTDKHNHYATKEAIELLNYQFNFFNLESVEPNLFGSQEQRKRWLKIKYANLPLFLRPFLYFFYRYFIKFGFLDGKSGLVWHFLQGFWYRFLVDAKIFDIKRRAKNNNKDVLDVLKDEYGVKFE